MVHVCAKTNNGRAEVQIKSNRGVTLEVHRPGSPQYLWVQDQPTVVRRAFGAALHYDPSSWVLLPAGDTMTLGYTQPATTQNLTFTISGRTWRANVHTVLQDIVNYAAGLAADSNAALFLGYMISECSLGVSTSSYHLDTGSMVDFLQCVSSRLVDVVKSPQAITAFAERFGGGAADAAALDATIKAAQSQFKLVALIAPALRATFGNALDGIQNLLTKGSSDAFRVTLKGSGAKAPTGGKPSTGWGASTGGGTAPVAMGTGRVMISPCLDLHSAPGHSTTVIGCLPNGTLITLQCTAQASSVTGKYGTTTIWDRTSYAGKTGYVTDAYVYTGTNGAAAPACTTSAPAPTAPAAPPAPAPTAIGKVIISSCLDLHSGVGHTTSVIGCIPNGTIIPIVCTATGNSVTGPYGATTLWDRTSYGGLSGYVTDAYVYTGTAAAVAPHC